MPNMITMNMSPSLVDNIIKGKQICLLHEEQQCFVGDIFSVDYLSGSQKFKIIDVWYTPKDFALKFLWRMCGLENSEELSDQLEGLEMVYAHIFTPVSWTEIQRLVI